MAKKLHTLQKKAKLALFDSLTLKAKYESGASMDKFVYTLRKLPRFEVKLGRLGCVGGEFIQKRVDIALAADLVRLSCGRMIQKAVLVTGDSDFMPAIEAAKDAGVLVTLYYSQSSIHDELLSAVDESAVMDQELISQVTR